MARYTIAGLRVEMTVTGRTQAQAEPYLTQAAGEADITLTYDIPQLMALNPQLTDPDIVQYLGTGALFSRKLLEFSGSYLHASAVLLEGKAYLFSAPSGTGKSTHTEKWCRLFGAQLLNDDKPALRHVEGTWMAYGTPWSGKHDLSIPTGVPLGGIAFLKRGDTNTIRRLQPREAVPLFMSQSLWRLTYPEAMERQLAFADGLLQQIPVWELTCRNDDDAARVSRQAMTLTEE